MDVKIIGLPEKPLQDKKEYRLIELNNGLKALLISDMASLNGNDSKSGLLLNDLEHSEPEECDSDNTTESEDEEDIEENFDDETRYLSAASLCVGVGSFEDFNRTDGLMHFLEHMVFMGSKKYPKENTFSHFISKNGGNENAHTDFENTTFYFDVQEQHFVRALKLFSHFFISPLLKMNAMQRERKAVHCEFQDNLASDDSRKEQLLCSLAKETHPLSVFPFGNEITLQNDVTDEQLHKTLHEIRSQFYSAQYMTLAVQARESLDTLQEVVSSIFSKVPNNGLALPSYKTYGSPYVLSTFNRLYKIIPIKDRHTVDIYWSLPCLQNEFMNKPLEYIANLVGHEGHGSIISYLKKRVWAIDLYSGNDESGFNHNTTNCMYNVHINLTDTGLENVSLVIQAVFQYIRMLELAVKISGDALSSTEVGTEYSSDEPCFRIFKELQNMDQIDFDYREEKNSIENVEELSESMRLYPCEHVISGPFLMHHYNPRLIQRCLSALTPENCIVLLSSMSFESADMSRFMEEKWFRTKYTVEEIPTAWKILWHEQPLVEPRFHLPTRNEFIPNNLALIPKFQFEQSRNNVNSQPNENSESSVNEIASMLSTNQLESNSNLDLESKITNNKSDSVENHPTDFQIDSDSQLIGKEIANLNHISKKLKSDVQNEKLEVLSKENKNRNRESSNASLDSEKLQERSPELLLKNAHGEVWHKRDYIFKLPRAYCYFYVHMDVIKESAEIAAMLDFFMNLFSQHIMEPSYPAKMAQYEIVIRPTELGFVLKVDGFNQHIFKVIKMLLTQLDNFENEITDEVFNSMKQQQIMSYSNGAFDPDVIRTDIRLSLLQETHWSVLEKLKALTGITKESFFKSFFNRLRSKNYLKVLIEGNITEKESLEIFNYVSNTFCNSLNIPCPVIKVRKLSTGEHFFRIKSLNSSSSNSTVINYYQGDIITLRGELLHEFVQMILAEPVFDYLRTNDQLGYAVYATHRNTFGVLGLSITVHSHANKHTVAYVNSRIEQFLKDFSEKFDNTTAEEFRNYKETLKSLKLIVDQTLKEEIERNWSEIISGDYLFDRFKKQLKIIDTITLKEVSSELKKLTQKPENTKQGSMTSYRKISLQVEGSEKPENGVIPSHQELLQKPMNEILKYMPITDEDVNLGLTEDQFVENLEKFRQKMNFFDPAKI